MPATAATVCSTQSLPVLIFVWSIILMSIVWCWSFSIMKPVFIYEAVYCDEVFAVIQVYLYNMIEI